MKKEYIMPAVEFTAIQKPMILAGSSEEVVGGGSTDKAPEAKSSYSLDDFADEE